MATGFRNLIAYKKVFSLAMDINKISQSFPVEERYGLTSEIRDCSDQFVPPLEMATVSEGIRRILSPKFRMQIWKIPKFRFGWILHLRVSIFQKKIMTILT